MRANVPAYDIVAPAKLDDVLSLLSESPGAWKPFAGGTDLMVLFEAGRLDHKQFVNIWGLEELRGISIDDDYVSIGALTTYSELRESGVIESDFPLLALAAKEIGGLAIQNRGTVGGNIVNGSPAADSPPALLVYDAELELVSSAGTRVVPYNGFHHGYKMMDLRPDELVKSIKLPRRTSGWRQYYRKVGTRKAQAISKICFAGMALMEGSQIADVRIAMASVAPTVLRCSITESVLRGQPVTLELIEAARQALARDISPIDDIRSTSRYRSFVSGNLLEDFIESLA